jgi:3-oxoacyl-[acyl-carrier protein] reductase
VTDVLAADAARVHHTELDLATADAPDRLIDAATAAFGHLDILVCNHARSGGDGPLGTLDAAMLDTHWAVNTRSTLLLAQAFAA